MRTVDFAPLYRSTIGFDDVPRLIESALRMSDTEVGYPPYNIELLEEDNYRITLAVAGFKQDELDIEVKNGRLTVSGSQKDNQKERKFLHHGIANRSFERSYQLADYVQVKGAQLKDGLLHVDLVREIPEAMKPRKIAIASEDKEDRLIEGESVAA